MAWVPGAQAANQFATMVVAIWCNLRMNITRALKNIVDLLYQRIKHTAALHRRGLNGAAIAGLEARLLPAKSGTGERLARARVPRASLPAGASTAEAIHQPRRDGRP